MNRSAIRAWIEGSGNWLTDVIFPRRCPVCGRLLEAGSRRMHDACRELLTPAAGNVCEICGKLLPRCRSLCRECRSRSRLYDRGRSLWLHDRFMQKAIFELKYGNAREYGRLFGQEMADIYGKDLIEWKAEVLIPVPMYGRKRRIRGYNQTEVLARGLGRCTGIPVRKDLLVRIRETPAQKGLDRAARMRNLKGAFYCPDKSGMPESVCLIDDIYTTGSTLEECARTLREAGAKRVYFLTLSTGEDD